MADMLIAPAALRVRRDDVRVASQDI